MKTSRTISLFLGLGLTPAIPVRPDSYQDRELTNIQDQDLRMFKDQEDSEGIPVEQKSVIDYPEELKDDISAKEIPGEQKSVIDYP